AVGDPRSRARPHQGRPAFEVSAGFQVRRLAAHDPAAHRDSGRVDRRQQRVDRGGLSMSARIAGLALCLTAVVAGAAAADEVTLLGAAEAGDHETALALLRENPDVNARGPDGATALMWAAYNEDLELVKALIAHGADLKARNDFGA